MKKLIQKIVNHKTEVLLILCVIGIAGLMHAYNMFKFPYYENDEGVYMSQAWSIFTKNSLAPYTYWYDHAPGGWIFIALWTLVSGGFFTFGFSINSGRVFMLILHIFSCLFLYFITKKFTGSKLISALAIIVFSISPLGIYFQRRVLLDNIMVFWMLLSLVLLLYYKKKLRYIVLSAITFGISVLSKETAIFLSPIYLYILYTEVHSSHRIFALIKWLAIMMCIIGVYLMYALFKGEFFPYGTALGGTSPHVSLLDALKFQAGRGGGSIFTPQHSSFWQNMNVWVHEDPFIMYVGVVATIGNALIGIKKLSFRLVSLLSISLWVFLMRGGLVIEFYILPLIPLLALNIAVFTYGIYSWISHYTSGIIKNIKYIPVFAVLSIGILFSFYYAQHVRGQLNLFTSDQTSPQIEAIEWMLSKDLPNAFYVIDNYGYIELHKQDYTNFKYAEWYWKVDEDPEIKEKLLHGNEANIDYLAMTPQMKNDAKYSGLGLTLAAWTNSRPVTDFSHDMWDVDIWANNNPKRVLASSWESYKKYFIINGRVIDPYNNNNTTSEGESYCLLRAVWMNDKKTFDQCYQWSKKNLQQQQKLFAWKYENNKITDKGNATDADQDIALALLFAYKQWGHGNLYYYSEALAIIQGIWNQEISIVQGIPYVTAGNWANHTDSITINPSYLSPATYRIFAHADSSNPWIDVVDSSYAVLQACTEEKLDSSAGGLPPEWCSLDKETVTITTPQAPYPTATEYSYNAFRIPWRIALDYQWNKSNQAKAYLSSLDILQRHWKTSNTLTAAYRHNGEVWENYESVAAYSGDLGYFVVTNPKEAETIYKQKIFNKFYENRTQSYWEDPKNYFTKNWAWFGTGLYNNSLPNLWNKR